MPRFPDIDLPITRAPVVVGFCIIVSITLAGAALFTRGVNTNLFLRDALWFADVGQLTAAGLVPHRDFAWPFGGYEAWLIGLAMQLFGTSMRAVQQAAAFHYLIAVALLFVGTARRVRWPTFAMLLLLLSAVALTRFPFENGPGVNIDVQSFSMWYNRIAWSLTLVVFATLLAGRKEPAPAELAVAGASLYLLVLTKLTFGLFAPLVIVFAWCRSGWHALGWLSAGSLAALLLVWLITGVGPPEYPLMLRDLQQNYADYLTTENRFGPVMKLAYMLMTQALPVFGLFSAGVYLWARNAGWRLLAIGMLLVFGFLVGVTTGAFGALTAVPPALGLVAILLADQAFDEKGPGNRVLTGALTIYALAFLTPYLLNYAAGIAKGQLRTGQSIFAHGALAGLVVDRLDSSTLPTFGSKTDAVVHIQKRATLERGMLWASDHEWQYVYADAAELVAPYRRLRISSLVGGVSHTVLETPPTRDFTFFYGVARPGASRSLPKDFDGVLVPNFQTANGATEFFRPSIDRDFRFVKRSKLWTLYLRK